MSSVPPIFFWQNMPAHHQLGALDRLAARWSAPVTAVWAGDLSAQRVTEGWRTVAVERLRQITLPSVGWKDRTDELVAAHGRALHVFSGLGAYPQVDRAMRGLRSGGSDGVGVIAETVFKEPCLHLPRYFKSRIAYARNRRMIRAAFGIGSAGEEFFRRMGLDDDVIFPYVYQATGTAVPRTPGSGRLAFVGKLERYKGPDILLEALAGCRDLRWTLDVYGDGSLGDELRRRAAASGMDGKITFHGVIPSDQVVPRLCQADICVLPSRYDGWGMAVSEAVRAGATVLVSDAAGSVDVPRALGVGAHFRSGDVARLRALIRERLLNRPLVETEQGKAAALSPRMSPESVGDYLAAVMRHAFLGEGPRPLAPWRS